MELQEKKHLCSLLEICLLPLNQWNGHSAKLIPAAAMYRMYFLLLPVQVRSGEIKPGLFSVVLRPEVIYFFNWL